MQAVYSNYFTTSDRDSKNTLTKHFKQKDVFVRSEKRSPYDDSSASPRKSPKDKGPTAGIAYMALTLLLLMVLYPVGLFLLWARRLRWSVAAKLLLTVTTAVIFCALVAFLINFETDNPMIKNMQESVSDGLSYINEYTGAGVDAAIGWLSDRYDDGIENLEHIWNAVDGHVAEKYLSLYDHVDEDIKAVKVDLPLAVIQKYRDITDTPYSGGKKANTAATPDRANETVKIEPTAQPTATVPPTVAPNVTPTAPAETAAANASTTQGEATVEMPPIMDIASAPVYYYDTGVSYHSAADCSPMTNAPMRTLMSAQTMGKTQCEKCQPLPLSALDYTDYLWGDAVHMAHTTINCSKFSGEGYEVIGFKALFASDYSYCEECKADIVYELKGGRDASTVVSTPNASGSSAANQSLGAFTTRQNASVSLPEIKDVSLAPVFFTNGGKWYHATSNCQKMMNAVSHTLGEAKDANKLVCDVCGVIPLSMLDSEHYLWLDVAHTAHTTDECRMFAQGKYTVLPYEDIYGKNYPFCEACGAKECLAYIEQNKLQFTINSEGLDEATLALYEYEKTITVYYGDNSRKYHSDADCMYMTDAKYRKTLYMALHVDNKQRCSICSAITEEDAMRQMSAGM